MIIGSIVSRVYGKLGFGDNVEHVLGKTYNCHACVRPSVSAGRDGCSSGLCDHLVYKEDDWRARLGVTLAGADRSGRQFTAPCCTAWSGEQRSQGCQGFKQGALPGVFVLATDIGGGRRKACRAGLGYPMTNVLV